MTAASSLSRIRSWAEATPDARSVKIEYPDKNHWKLEVKVTNPVEFVVTMESGPGHKEPEVLEEMLAAAIDQLALIGETVPA